jgi:hypothetical protein
MTAGKCSIVGQLGKLRAGCLPALLTGWQPAAGFQLNAAYFVEIPAPKERQIVAHGASHGNA